MWLNMLLDSVKEVSEMLKANTIKEVFKKNEDEAKATKEKIVVNSYPKDIYSDNLKCFSDYRPSFNNNSNLHQQVIEGFKPGDHSHHSANHTNHFEIHPHNAVENSHW